jgi:hypothetical protein
MYYNCGKSALQDLFVLKLQNNKTRLVNVCLEYPLHARDLMPNKNSAHLTATTLCVYV